MPFVSGFLAAVPAANKDAYKKMAEEMWPYFKGKGALSMRENWGVDVPDGKVTSFPMAVKKEENEVVVFSWVEWPDKQTCDKAWKDMMEDPQFADMDASKLPFDGKRMIWGGFEELINVRA